MFGQDPLKDAVLLTRSDPYALLGTCSPHGFELDGRHWLSAEHYYQASKFAPGAYYDRIHAAPNPTEAMRLGEARFRRKRRDWKANRVTYMTRALYIKCRTHAEVAEHLLATGERPIIENSLYDYFWGCGRDGRGENAYGRMLERIRQRLREEDAGAPGA
ncbi:MAG: NADAR family protein [Gammaproteobacteria bacterium]